MFEIIQAMAEPTRFAILKMVHNSEMSAGEIARQFKGITRPAVSQHLGVLKNAGLISQRREGTRRIYMLRPEGFAKLKALLEDFWDPRLKKLKEAAEKSQAKSRRTT
jgi:DNA-binding transcriptional ArsR family regulator